MGKVTRQIVWFVICSAVVLAGSIHAETVRVAVCQMRVEDGQIATNLAKAETMIRKASEAGAKICVLPELVDVGFGKIVKAKRSPTKLAFPIPGRTSDRLGAIAKKYGVWISAALLEKVPGGGYDTNILIDSRGAVVQKQRKAFVYPKFAGTPAFPGNYLDVRAVRSPWGPLAVMNCADTNNAAKRKALARERPSLIFINFANPQAGLLRNCNKLATEAGCPVVGTNMIFPPGGKHKGGKSRFVSAKGRTLFEAGQTEVMKTWDLTVRVQRNRPPRVAAGDLQTIRLPKNRTALDALVLDDALPDGTLKLRWSKLGGPGKVVFKDAAAAATTATFSASGVYTLRLTADDGADSASDVVSVNVLGTDGRDPNLVGYWTFDGTAEDRSGNGNHAKLQGKAVYSRDAAPTGFPNTHAISLDRNTFVMVLHSSSLDAPDAVTVALWVKFRSLPPMWPTRKSGWVAFLSKGKWWKENYALGVGEYFYVFGRAFGGMLCPGLETTIRRRGEWHHVATVFVAAKREGKLYIDGVLNQRVFNVPTDGTNSEPIYMGRFSHESVGLDGLLDDVRVYRRALSDGEIASLVPGAKVNRAPVVDAGRDLRISLPRKARLRGTCKDDRVFPSSLTAGWTRWRQVSGPGEVHFSNRYATTTTADFAKPGEYVLELRASDGAHLVSDTVRVTVK